VIVSLKSDIRDLDSQISELSRQISDLDREIRELEDLKGKLNNIDETEKNYVIDEKNRDVQLVALQKKYEAQTAINDKLADERKMLEPAVGRLKDAVENNKSHIIESRIERNKLFKEVRELEEKKITVDSKLAFMQENIRFDEDMKKFNIEELKSVLATNTLVNDTIRDFMGKWDILKRFSKLGQLDHL